MNKIIKERPILFKSEMVRAILDGRKTQTRRVIKPRSYISDVVDNVVYEMTEDGDQPIRCPYGKPGDWLWVRETWANGYAGLNYIYKADCDNPLYSETKWKPSIHMPRIASRILLEIIDVRVERVKDITRSDIRAEGLVCPQEFASDDIEYNYKQWYPDEWIKLWNSINESRGYGWDVNPWVWVVEFKKL